MSATHAQSAGRETRRKAYVVLGPHRSGTSSVAGTLAKLGITPPKTLTIATSNNERGHWEPVRVIELNDAILASVGTRWDDWRAIDVAFYDSDAGIALKAQARAILREEYGTSGDFMFKEPRSCRLMPFWLDVFVQENIAPHFLLTLRPPLEVAQSHLARDDFPLSKGLLLWLRHILDAEYFSRGYPRIALDWATFLRDWRGTIQRAEPFGLRLADLSATQIADVDTFLSADLRHQRGSRDSDPVDSNAWLRETYLAMQSLTADAEQANALATLDRVRAQFDQACALFGPLVPVPQQRPRQSKLGLKAAAWVHHPLSPKARKAFRRDAKF